MCGCAPTAQAAYQQGKFLGRVFRDSLHVIRDKEPKSTTVAVGGAGNEGVSILPAFKYNHKGSLAYTGGGKGVAELKSLWDSYPSGTPAGQVRVEGTSAFAIWRSLYFSRILSVSNQAQVLFDWTKAFVFGRDISTPFVDDDEKPRR